MNCLGDEFLNRQQYSMTCIICELLEIAFKMNISLYILKGKLLVVTYDVVIVHSLSGFRKR